MKTVIIHGQSHQGSTYHIARQLADKLDGTSTEFFLPRDFGAFCVGCARCIKQSETLCPHREALFPILQAMEEADVIVLESPVYVYHVTGSMKAFLDHCGYFWMVHRPWPSMFRKQVVCISTAAGAGMKSTTKDLADSAFFWGAGKIYRYGIAISAMSWQHVTPEKRKKIDAKTTQIAEKIRRNAGHVTPSLKTKAFFSLMRRLQKDGWNEADKVYWQSYGWDKAERPWKF